MRFMEMIKKKLPTLEITTIIKSSLKKNGLIIKIDNLEQSIRIINKLAPEHLHLAFDHNELDTKDLIAGIILEFANLSFCVRINLS